MTVNEARTQYLLKLCRQVQHYSMYGKICRMLKPSQLPVLLAELKEQINENEESVREIVGLELFNYIKYSYNVELTIVSHSA